MATVERCVRQTNPTRCRAVGRGGGGGGVGKAKELVPAQTYSTGLWTRLATADEMRDYVVSLHSCIGVLQCVAVRSREVRIINIQHLVMTKECFYILEERRPLSRLVTAHCLHQGKYLVVQVNTIF